jgi:Ca2+-binding RTX toxin-like protein
MRNSSHEVASASRNRIGAVQSAIGSVTVERTGVSDFRGCPGDIIYIGDAIVTGADSAATVVLDDGTLVRLSANACAVLREPDRLNGIASVALRTRLHFDTAASASAEDRTSLLPNRAGGSKLPLGLRILSLAVMAYALLRDIEHARAFTTDDDTITPKDSEYGTFEIITKSGTVILVDDPALTYVVDDDGSVERHVNSSARMEELQAAQQAVLGTLAQGFVGAPGSGTQQDSPGVLDLQPLTVPINFRPLDPVPERIAPVFTTPPEETPVILPEAVLPPPAPPVITTFTFDSGIDGDRITNNNALTLIGTATPGTTISIFDSGALVGSTSADASGVWSFDTGQLSDGEHAFTAAASASANPAARSAFATLAAAPSASNNPTSDPYIVVIDTRAPDAPVMSEVAGAPGDGPTQDDTPFLTIAAEAGSTVHVYRNGELVGIAMESETPGIFTFASDALPDGCHTFTATATDIANNTSKPSCALTIDIDGTAPDAPVIALADPSCCADGNLTDDPTPKLVIAAEAGSTVHVYRDGALVGTATETGKAGIFIFTSPELSDGDHTFTATATDDANNLSAPSADLIIAVVTSDPNDFDELATGECVTSDPDGTVHGTRHDDFIWFKSDHCDPGRTIYAGAGEDYVKGTDRDDVIYAGSGSDKVFGNSGNDILFGGFGNDKLSGGKGDDIIVGGYGADFLSGGKGCDTFMFLSKLDSLACARDVISDFDCHRDKIDLTAIDADESETGDQAFIFAGQTESRSVSEHAVTWYYDRKSDYTYILADTDGDTDTAELEIVLAGKVALTDDHFVL